MSKKHYILTGIGMLIVAVVMFSPLFASGGKAEAIYDDNLRISDDGDTYTYYFKAVTNFENKCTMKYKMSGMETLYDVKSYKDTQFEVKYSSEVNKGDFKAVLIHPDDSITTIFEGSGEDTVNIDLPEGEYRIKVVGRNAKGDMILKPIENENVSVERREKK